MVDIVLYLHPKAVCPYLNYSVICQALQGLLSVQRFHQLKSRNPRQLLHIAANKILGPPYQSYFLTADQQLHNAFAFKMVVDS